MTQRQACTKMMKVVGIGTHMGPLILVKDEGRRQRAGKGMTSFTIPRTLAHQQPPRGRGTQRRSERRTEERPGESDFTGVWCWGRLGAAVPPQLRTQGPRAWEGRAVAGRAKMPVPDPGSGSPPGTDRLFWSFGYNETWTDRRGERAWVRNAPRRGRAYGWELPTKIRFGGFC